MGRAGNSLKVMMLAGVAMLSACTEADIYQRKLVGYGVVQFVAQWGDVQPGALDIYYYKVGDNLVPEPRRLPAANLRDTIPVGRYRVLAVKPEATGASFGNLETYEWGQIMANTYSGSLSFGDVRLLAAPASIFAVAVSEVNIAEDKTVEVSLVSPDWVRSIGLSFTLADDAEVIRSISGALCGAVPAIYMTTGAAGEVPANAGSTGVPFEVAVAEKKATVVLDLLGIYNPKDGTNYDCKALLELYDAEGNRHELAADLNQFVSAILMEYGPKLATTSTLAAEIDIRWENSKWVAVTRVWDRDGTIGEIS